MEEKLLVIKNLRSGLEDKEILKGIDLEIGKGETHVIMGPNGAGKSTLGNVIMGNPVYTVTAGTAEYCGEDLFEMSVSERAKKGIFMSFQNPIEVPGISLENFLRSASEEVTGERVRIWPFQKVAQIQQLRQLLRFLLFLKLLILQFSSLVQAIQLHLIFLRQLVALHLPFVEHLQRLHLSVTSAITLP